MGDSEPRSSEDGQTGGAVKQSRLAAGLALAVALGATGGMSTGCDRLTETTEAPVAEPPAAEPAQAQPPEKAAPVKQPEPPSLTEWVVSPGNDQPEGEPGHRLQQTATGIEVCYVPAGTFTMGSADDDRDAFDDERPAHKRRVDAFWIGRTEVTVGQWRSVMGSVPGKWNDQGDDHPVVEVTWHEAVDFCQRLGLALPTEAQWEYAARGPESRRYPWGHEWDPGKCCNHGNAGPGGQTFPVGSLPEDRSWCGAMDMAGNVFEWCTDWYDEDAHVRYARGDLAPASVGRYRAVRGASWLNGDPKNFRAASRNYLREPQNRFASQGFRCTRRAEQ